MKVRFSKMHGLGNDFIVINNTFSDCVLTREQIEYLCDRKFGIGCDQLLSISKPTDGVSDFLYQIFNVDGSIARQCGNGARCIIRYITERKLISAKRRVQLQTVDREISGRMLDDGMVEVDMGSPVFEAAAVPLLCETEDHYEIVLGNGEIVRFAALSMGNAHAVIQLHKSTTLGDDCKLAKISESLQQSALFPDSVSVNFIFIQDRLNILLRTYERGGGFTFACGSGTCASVAVAIRDGLVDDKVTVRMPGGSLDVEWRGGHLLMCGSATHVFDGEIVL